MKIFYSTLLLSSVLLVSCGSDNEKSVVDQTFSDATVSNFQQATNIAKNQRRLSELLISSAYAGSGNIKCFSGESVEFQMDVTLGASTTTETITGTCNSTISNQIRRGLLEALDGKTLIREVSQAGTGVNYQLDFTGGFNFNSPYKVLEESKTNGVTRNCYLDYTFDFTTGLVSLDTKDSRAGGALSDNETANDDFSIANPHDGSSGCFSKNTDFNKIAFRFIDGKVEFDESGTGNFSDKGCAKWTGDTLTDYKENGDGSGNCPDAGYESTYERWCVDNNTDGTCDTI